MEISWLPILFCTAAGVLLGVFYFASLWWVVRRLPGMSRPGVWFPLSTLLRMAIVLGAIFLLIEHRWPRLLAVMLGFLVGRYLVFWQLGVPQHRS